MPELAQVGTYVEVRAQVGGVIPAVVQYQGREHLVVPVVAMVANTVIRGVGSKGPEIVPPSVLACAPAGWNGRPVLPGHPNEGRSLANSPEILAARQFGTVFNSRFEDDRLKMEAWIDPSRAEEIGPDAVSVVDRLRKGQMVEVSVGALIAADYAPGEIDGVEYEYVWTFAVSDHLAMLAPNVVGACSIEKGCGTRANSDSEEDSSVTTEELKAQLVRFQNLFTPQVEDRANEVSDADLRYSLQAELHKIVPAFDGIIAVFVHSHTVIYCSCASGSYLYYSRTFALDNSNGSITLNDDEKQVQAKTDYVPVSYEPEVPVLEPHANCTCQHPESNTSVGTSAAPLSTEGGRSMASEAVKSLVGRLISHARSKFTEANRETLEAFSEEQLTPLVDALEPAPVEPPKELTEEEKIAALPVALQEVITEGKQRAAQETDFLVTALSKVKGAPLSEAVLRTKPLAELRMLAKFANVAQPVAAPIDFSGKGVATDPSISANSEENQAPPVRSLRVALAEKRKA